MRQERGLAQYQVAHGFEVVQRAAITAFAQQVTHFGKCRLRLITEREERLGTTELFTLPRDLKNLIGRHGMRARLSGIAPIRAVAAIVAAKIGQRKEDLSRVSNNSRAILFLQVERGRQQLGINGIVTAQKLDCGLARDNLALTDFAQERDELG